VVAEAEAEAEAEEAEAEGEAEAEAEEAAHPVSGLVLAPGSYPVRRCSNHRMRSAWPLRKRL